MPVFFQPFPVYLVIGKDRFHTRPKIFGMVHMFQMAQFMNDYVVQHVWWSQHEPPVEGEGTAAAATPPAGLLVTDGNGGINMPDQMTVVFGIISSPLRNIGFGSGPVSLFQSKTLFGCEL